MMKIKLLKVLIMGSVVVLGLFSCAHPNAKDIDYSDRSTTKDSSDFVNTNPLSKMEKPDDLLDYIDHNAEIDARYVQNINDLNEMKKYFKSDVNAIQMKYDQGLYELKKINLKIKTKVNDHVIQDTKSWDDFKSTTNNEMNSLEKSIKVLAE